MTKPYVWKGPDAWWLSVPQCLLLGRERGLYHRRSFAAILRLLDFHLARARRPRLVDHG